jgi:hypothetical protein
VPGYLGVWMSHEQTDFGLIAVVPPPPRSLQGSMRTGLTEALLTDEEDDSYDLSWLERIPGDPVTAIGHLRRLLKDDPDPMDRHFMYCELEDRLYRSRDAFASALEEYNETCTQHDAEMDGIREALLAKFGRVAAAIWWLPGSSAAARARSSASTRRRAHRSAGRTRTRRRAGRSGS